MAKNNAVKNNMVTSCMEGLAIQRQGKPREAGTPGPASLRLRESLVAKPFEYQKEKIKKK